MVVPDGNAATTRAVPGFDADNVWKDGDEVMIKLMLMDKRSLDPDDPDYANAAPTNTYVIFTTARWNATASKWELQLTADSYVAHVVATYPNGPGTDPVQVMTVHPHADLPLLYTNAEGKVQGLRVPETFEVSSMLVMLGVSYAPGLKWTLVAPGVDPSAPEGSPSVMTMPKPDIPVGTTGYWAIRTNTTGTYSPDTGTITIDATTDDIGDPINFATRFSRLRIYLGADYAGQQVKLSCYRFSYAYGNGNTIFYRQSPDRTYTATVDPAGNACFYGITQIESTGANIELDGSCPVGQENTLSDYRLVITLLGTPSTDGAHTILFQASPYAKIQLVGGTGKSFAINGLPAVAAKKLDAEEITDAQLSAMTYPQYVTALVTAANNGKTLWRVMAKQDKVTGWNYDNGETILEGIKAALMDTNVSSKKIHIDLPEFEGKVTDFRNCTTLASVSMPKATGIGDSAFKGCTSLQSASLPEVTGNIGSSAFEGCTALESVDLRKVTGYVGGSAFKGCTSLTAISLPLAKSTATMSAFQGCTSLISASLPKVQTLGGRDFMNCEKLQSVYLPQATKLMNSYTFDGCKALKSISLPLATEMFGSTFYGCEALESVSLPLVAKLGSSTFQGCKALTSISLPEATKLGDDTFSDCEALESASLPLVATLGSSTFYGCKALTSISLPKATTLGYNTFGGCTVLTSISLPQPGAWVSIDYDLFGGFGPSAACTVQLAAGSYNVVGTSGSATTWSPKKEGDATAITPNVNDGTIYNAFVSGSTDDPKVNSNISFTTASTPAP